MTILFFLLVYSRQWGEVLSIYLIFSLWNLNVKRRSLRGKFPLFQVWGLACIGRFFCSLVLIWKVATFVPLATWAFTSPRCQWCLLQAGLPEKPFFHRQTEIILPPTKCCADLLFVTGAEKTAIWEAVFQAEWHSQLFNKQGIHMGRDFVPVLCLAQTQATINSEAPVNG